MDERAQHFYKFDYKTFLSDGPIELWWKHIDYEQKRVLSDSNCCNYGT